MSKLSFIWYRVIGAFFRCLPINDNCILIENFFGRGFGDNPKYIAEELIRRFGNKVKIIWLVKKNSYKDIPEQIIQVKRRSLAGLYYLSTSKIWIDNARKHYGVKKRKNQFYIQTWHGGIAVKKIEKDCIDLLSKDYVKCAINDSKMIDLLLVNNKKFENIFLDNFWYKGKLLEIGSPRTDCFFEDVNEGELKTKLGFKKDVHLILYAPTFRENNTVDVYNLDYEKVLKAFSDKYAGNWELIIRLHPNISYLQDNIEYTDSILNGSNYSDINELIKVSDFLITDYSSCMFDAMFAKKNVLLYAADEEEYNRSRGVYLQSKDLPFALGKTTDEFIKIINQFNKNEYDQRVTQFLKEIGSFEKGTASIEVVNRIQEVIGIS